MQFSFVALAVLATGGSAAPLKPLSNRAGLCNMNTCVAALAPSFPTACNPAVAQAGANTPFNAACFASAARSTTAFPPACTQCAAQFGATDPANNAQGGNANLPNANGADPGSPAAGNGNRPNANGAPARGANPVATNNQAPGAGSSAAVGPRASACDINACVVTLEPSFPL
ncbi:hypothetical protein C8J57DRAFT_69130 [Mycena rebaudengoi]|nr:hypothetical protein C8J57DRAFT_69130 [Mycena rebaudengoi]